jgi:hypothetical protein
MHFLFFDKKTENIFLTLYDIIKVWETNKKIEWLEIFSKKKYKFMA